MILKLLIMELTVSVHIDKYGFGGRTRYWKRFLQAPKQTKHCTLTFNLGRTLFVQMYEVLDYTMYCCQYQQWLRVLVDTICGLELSNLALRQDQYNTKKHCPSHRTAWMKLLQRNIVHGSVFCDGLGDVFCRQVILLPVLRNTYKSFFAACADQGSYLGFISLAVLTRFMVEEMINSTTVLVWRYTRVKVNWTSDKDRTSIVAVREWYLGLTVKEFL